MDKRQRTASAFNRAFELAGTGQFSGWRAIETHLRPTVPEIRDALAPTQDKNIIDEICRQHYRGAH